MMNFANSPSLHGRNYHAPVDMAPPMMAALHQAAYREKDLLNKLGGHKFTGNHTRSTEYIFGMNASFSELQLTPFATGVASIIVNDGTPAVRFADASNATSNTPNSPPHKATTAKDETTTSPLTMGHLGGNIDSSPSTFDAGPFVDANVFDQLSGEEKDDPDHHGRSDGDVTASESQFRSLFSDEDEGQRGLNLHRQQRQNGIRGKTQHRVLFLPVPTELMQYMYSLIAGSTSSVLLNVHIAVTGSSDVFGNPVSGSPNAFFHQVSADLYTRNITTVYNMILASCSGSVQS